MARFLFAPPLTLTLVALSATANAAPTISTQGPGDGGAPAIGASSSLSVVCQIDGRSEPLIVENGRLRNADGITGATVTELEPGVFLIDRGQSTMVLTATSAQINGGPDAGKYDCVQASAGPAPIADPVTAPAIDPEALAAMEQRLENARAALAATQDDLINAMLARDTARNILADVEGQRDAAWEDLRGLQVELAELRDALSSAQAAQASAEADLAARDAALRAAQEQILTGDQERANLETALAAAEAENAALRAELAAIQAEAAEAEEEAMPEEEGDMGEGDQDAALIFDADAAMAMLDAADISDISRAALRAAVEQARANPAMIGEVMMRLQNAIGQ